MDGPLAAFAFALARAALTTRRTFMCGSASMVTFARRTDSGTFTRNFSVTFLPVSAAL